MLRPPRVRPGDTVRIIAPSGPVPADLFAQGVAVLQTRYRLRYDEPFLQQGYLAGPDQARLEQLRLAFTEPDSQAIVMARGGYGLLRIVAGLDPDLLASNPKPVVGFSDGTVLLAQLARAGLTAIHGPVVTQIARVAPSDQQALFSLLEDCDGSRLFDGLLGLVPGRAVGPLLGGNLETFSRLLGTPFLPDLAGAVLFFEDVGERPYRVDRLLTQLELAGVFAAAAGVVMGEFLECVEPATARWPSPTVSQVIQERLAHLPIPVAVGGAFGHGKRNRPLPYGARVELDAGAGTLTSLEGAVS